MSLYTEGINQLKLMDTQLHVKIALILILLYIRRTCKPCNGLDVMEIHADLHSLNFVLECESSLLDVVMTLWGSLWQILVYFDVKLAIYKLTFVILSTTLQSLLLLPCVLRPKRQHRSFSIIM